MALPLHPRVLAGSAPGEYSVSWSMGAATTSPRLLWGLDPTALNSTVEASEKIVSKDLLCGAPATEKGWLDLGVVASAPLLLANFAGQRVYYALADQSSPSGTGKVYSFSVPPLPGAGGYPFSFTAFGDLGRGVSYCVVCIVARILHPLEPPHAINIPTCGRCNLGC